MGKAEYDYLNGIIPPWLLRAQNERWDLLAGIPAAAWDTAGQISKIVQAPAAFTARQDPAWLDTVQRLYQTASNVPFQEILGSAQEQAKWFSQKYLYHQAPWQFASDRLWYMDFYAQRERELRRLNDLAGRLAAAEDFHQPVEVSESQRQAASAEAKAILDSGENWEQRFMESIAKYRKTHPVVAWVLEKIFFAILIGVATSLASSAVGRVLHPANLYEEPRTSSQVICRIEESETVVIVGEAPYYYQIERGDENTKQLIVGYASKRTIRLYEKEECLGEEEAP